MEITPTTMREKPSKILIDFHFKLRVQKESVEAKIYEYITDESATPYSRSKLIIDALMAFYLPLVTKYHGSNQDELEKALIDANYLWQWHFWYLQKSLGIDLPVSTFSSPSSTPTSIPTFPNFHELAQQYVKPQMLTNPLPQPQPEPEREGQPSFKYQEDTFIEEEQEEEEGEYPDLFKDQGEI